MTKAEMVKGIADLKTYTLNSKERIAKAEAKIAETKKDLNEAIDSERLIKALEHEIEVEKTSIADNDRMIAEFTAELNKIEATGDNVEAVDYVVTPEAQEVAAQAEIEANIEKAKKVVRYVYSNSGRKLWSVFGPYYVSRYCRGRRASVTVKFYGWQRCKSEVAEAELSKYGLTITQYIEILEKGVKAADYVVTPETQEAAVQAEIDNAVNAEAADEDYIVTPEAQEVAVQAEIDNAVNAEVREEFEKCITSAILLGEKNFRDARKKTAGNRRQCMLYALWSEYHYSRGDHYRRAKSDFENEIEYYRGLKRLTKKHKAEIAKLESIIADYSVRIAFSNIVSSKIRKIIEAYENYAEAVDYIVTPEAQEVAVQAEIDNAINAEAIGADAVNAVNIKADVEDYVVAPEAHVDIELINENALDESVDNNDDADEEEIVVETVDIDDDNELIDPPEIQTAQYMAIDVYSPPIEIQTADEVEAERLEKLQQFKSQLDATIKVNSANIDKLSDAISEAEIDEKPADDLCEVYFDLIDQNKRLRAFKLKIESELTPAEAEVDIIDIEDDSYDDLWWKAPKFDDNTKASKINLLTLNAPMDAVERQSIIDKIIQGDNAAIVNDGTITIGKLNVKLTPSDKHLPTKEIVKRARQYFGLQSKSPVKATRVSETEDEKAYVKKQLAEYLKTHRKPSFDITGIATETVSVNPADIFKLIQRLAPARYCFDRTFAGYTIFSNVDHTFGFVVDFVKAEFPLTREIVSSNIRRVIFGNDDELISLVCFNADNLKNSIPP